VRIVVATSPAYVSEYFKGWQHLNQVDYYVIENKLEPDGVSVPQVVRPVMPDGVLRIGYFGLLRCERSWEILKRAAKEGRGRLLIVVRGIPMGLPNLVAEAQALPHIEYGGPYEAPADLPTLYSQIDMVWAAYGYMGRRIGNWRWARTNRFYESCFFGKPMFAQTDTADGHVVSELGLGTCVDMASIEKAAESILNISATDMEAWVSNLRCLAPELYVHTDEHQRLLDRLSA
jgi:succinoglycan biosynthesis protein ExoL